VAKLFQLTLREAAAKCLAIGLSLVSLDLGRGFQDGRDVIRLDSMSFGGVEQLIPAPPLTTADSK